MRPGATAPAAWIRDACATVMRQTSETRLLEKTVAAPVSCIVRALCETTQLRRDFVGTLDARQAAMKTTLQIISHESLSAITGGGLFNTPEERAMGAGLFNTPKSRDIRDWQNARIHTDTP